MVTKGVLARQREISRDIRLGVLHVIALVLSPIHPGLMLMVRIDVWRIRFVGERVIALRIWESTKVVVVGMVFLDDDHYVIHKRTKRCRAHGFRFYLSVSKSLWRFPGHVGFLQNKDVLRKIAQPKC